MKKNKTLITGIILTVVGFALLYAVKHHRANTSFSIPEPWWITDWLRVIYVSLFFGGIGVTLGGIVSKVVHRKK
jgi:uncharacterized membrane protein YsdA (DUF1294 family)